MSKEQTPEQEIARLREECAALYERFVNLQRDYVRLRSQCTCGAADDWEDIVTARKRKRRKRMSIFDAGYQNYVNENYEEADNLYCVCGHTPEDHYNDGSDTTAKVACEASLNDGSLCPCDDFTEESFEAK